MLDSNLKSWQEEFVKKLNSFNSACPSALSSVKVPNTLQEQCV